MPSIFPLLTVSPGLVFEFLVLSQDDAEAGMFDARKAGRRPTHHLRRVENQIEMHRLTGVNNVD